MSDRELAHPVTAQSSSLADNDDQEATTTRDPHARIENAFSIELKETPETPLDVMEDGSALPGDTPQLTGGGSDGILPPGRLKLLRGLSPFWHDRLIEAGLILSMGLYYVVGNTNFGAASVFSIPPYVYSLPFLAIFAFFCWYRPAFALALIPLALPYYKIQKTVFSYGSSHADFGLGEISLLVCVLVILAQLLWQRKRWRYRLSWQGLRERLGPFSLPILIFVAAALFSIVVAVSRSSAERAFREEVFDPLLYVALALCCLRTRQDIMRLLGAFLGSALIIAFIGLAQYFFFSGQLQQSLTGGRVLAVYGSANSIGLFFDYALPIALALFIFQVGQALRGRGKWWLCALLAVGFVPLIGVLVFSQSLGTALALPIALLFILALSVRNRKVLVLGTSIIVLIALVGGLALHKQIFYVIANWHDNSRGVSTITKRYYLWQVAINMIHHYPWFGVGMDNWLCHYTINSVCPTTGATPHFIIIFVPGSHTVGTGLAEEQTLSHPHDIFLQVWVSIGIFGLLAFLSILALFYWLFARIVRVVRRSVRQDVLALEWAVLGVGGSMLAALCQGLVDSSFLEQDLAFCFWMLIVMLLILRKLAGATWRDKQLKV